MDNKNIIIIGLVALVLILGAVITATTLTNTPKNNTTNESINVTINNTNNTTLNDTNKTETQQTTKKQTTQKKSNKKSSSDVTYDPELNDYFDSNGRTVSEGQFPKGTSKSEMRQALREIGDES